MGLNLKLSPFVTIFHKNGVYAFYHHLTLKKIYCNKSIKRLIDNLNKEGLSEKDLEIIDSFYKNKFLVDKDFNKEEFIRNIWNKKYKKPKINILYLLLTSACNFKCKYCFIENALSKTNRNKNEYMSKYTAKKMIDLFVEQVYKNTKNTRIFFYGGEPLLNKEVFKFAVKYLREKEKSSKFKGSQRISLNTNGSCIDEKMAKFFSRYNVKVGLSLDGWKEIHDKMRIYHDDSNTFEEVLQALNLLKKYNVTFSVSCTIGKHNVEYLPEIVKYFHNLGIKAIGFNPLMSIPGEKNPASVNSKKASEKLIEAYNETVKLGMFEDRIGNRRAKPFWEEKIHLKDCAGYGNQFIATPDGRIGPCHAFYGVNEYIYPLNEWINFKEDPVWNEWNERVPLNMKKCFDCPAIGICGGGCAYNAYLKKGSIWKIDKNICDLCNNVLKFLIWEYYKREIENPRIRKLRKTDAPGIKRLVRDLYEEKVKMGLERVYGEEDEWVKESLVFMEKNMEVYLVAEVSGEIIGFCNMIFEKNLSKKKNPKGLLGIGVRRDFRGKKIGETLLNKVVEKSAEIGVKEVHAQPFANNKRSLGFLSSHGFRKEKTIKNVYSYKNKPADKVVMIRSL